MQLYSIHILNTLPYELSNIFIQTNINLSDNNFSLTGWLYPYLISNNSGEKLSAYLLKTNIHCTHKYLTLIKWKRRVGR